MMNREQARKLYLELRGAGYSHDDAVLGVKTEVSGGQRDDPTSQYWDALIQQESGGRQGAVSPKGAVGIAQVMPRTGPEAAKLAGREWDEQAYREDPEYNAAIGRAYLRAQMQRFGDPNLGLAAYNAGPGRVQQHLDEGRPLPPETRNYVPAITGNSKMTREEARQYAQQRLAEGADLATIKQEIAQRVSSAPQPAAAPMPAAPQPAVAPEPAPAPQPAAAAPMPAPTPAPQPAAAPMPTLAALQGMQGQPQSAPAPAPAAAAPVPAAPRQDIDEAIQGYLEESWPAMSGDPGSRAIHGFSRGLAGVLRGGRQLWNQLGYTEEDKKKLEYLRDREKVARQFEEQINPSGSGLQLQDVAKMSPAVMAGAALGGPATVSGALQGAAQATAPGESRLANTLIGGGIGAAADTVVGGTKLVNFLRDRAKNTIGTRDALDDFTGRVLGGGRGSDSLPTYEGIAEKVTGKLRGLEDDFSKRYAAVEQADNLPKVKLMLAGKAGDEFGGISEEVAGVLTPKTQKLLNTIRSSGERTSDIVDDAGKNIRVDNYATFSDVRDAIREIRSAARKLNHDDISRLQLKKAEGMLKDDLMVWSGKNDTARMAWKEAQNIDNEYRKQVVPFYSKKTPLGRYLASETMDEKALNANLLSEDSGMAAKDALKRMPELSGDLRKLYGDSLRKSRGDITAMRTLESGTTKEALLSKPERDYLLKVANEIYREGGPAQQSSIMPTGASRLAEKMTFSEDLQRMIGGLRPYGNKAPAEYMGRGSQELIKYLRSLGVANTTEE